MSRDLACALLVFVVGSFSDAFAKTTVGEEAVELQDWLKQHGVDLTVAHVVRASTVCGRCRGLVASRHIDVGETILAMPGNLCISRGVAEKSPFWLDWSNWREEAELAALDDDDEENSNISSHQQSSHQFRHGEGAEERTTFALFLLGELATNGLWSSLARFLLADVDEVRAQFSSLWLEMFPTVKEVLSGTVFLRMLTSEARKLQEDFKMIKTVLGANAPSFESFVAAKFLSTSRLIDTPPHPLVKQDYVAKDGWNGPIMIPFADLLNHDESGGNVKFRFLTMEEAEEMNVEWKSSNHGTQEVNGSALGAVIIEATRKIAEGEPLSWHYGWRSNDKVLLTYGFAMPERMDMHEAPVMVGPQLHGHLRGDASLQMAKASLLAAPGGAWSQFPSVVAWLAGDGAKTSNSKSGLLALHDEMLTLCCASVTQRWHAERGAETSSSSPMAQVLAYFRLEQADAPIGVEALRAACSYPWSGWCFVPLDAATERRALRRVWEWALDALRQLTTTEQEDTEALALAAKAVEEDENSMPLRSAWYAHMVRIGERRLWQVLIQWLKVFDGLFDLIGSPDLLNDYANRVFTSPDVYPLHHYAREVLLPLLRQGRSEL